MITKITIVNVTGVFNGNDYGYDAYSNAGAATLLKTADGFVIDEYDESIANIIFNCNNLVYNGETIEV